jgi:hypothetical protein
VRDLTYCVAGAEGVMYGVEVRNLCVAAAEGVMYGVAVRDLEY